MPHRRRGSLALLALLATCLVACGGGGGGGTSSGTGTGTGAATAAPGGGVVPQGFDRVAIDLERPDGTVVAWCVWLAADAAARARGLMEVTDLGGLDGMLFTYDAPSSDVYYMRKTRLPLSIAFFDDGAFVSAADMPPCPDDDDTPPCPRYPADGPFTAALEVPSGGLTAAGIGPGALLSVGGPC